MTSACCSTPSARLISVSEKNRVLTKNIIYRWSSRLFQCYQNWTAQFETQTKQESKVENYHLCRPSLEGRWSRFWGAWSQDEEK
jgi:hypothetical protein